MNECEIDDFSQHFRWVLTLISRIKKAETNSAPLLSLDFIERPSIQLFDLFIPNDIQNIKRCSPPPAIYYAILSSILTKKNNFEDIVKHKNEDIFLYEYSISKLASLGYKPRNPCLPNNLFNRSFIDHANLCMCFEYVIADKSLTIEKLLDDIRRLPRSFFVLSSRGSRPSSSKQEQRSDDNCFYPTNIEDAVRLWLSKFPCLYGLKDLTQKSRSVKVSKSYTSTLPSISHNKSLNLDTLCNSIESLQSDIANGLHITAVLARAFPQRLNKNDILQNDSVANWKISKEILENEIGAFVPSSFPISDNLFMCFISDVFYATRNGAKKFVKIDNHMINYYNKTKNGNNNTYNLTNKTNYISIYHNDTLGHDNICDNNGNIANNYMSNTNDNGDSNLAKNIYNCSKMIRDPNSIAASIVFKSSNRSSNNSTKHRSNSIKNKNSTQQLINQEEEELLRIYCTLNDSSSFFNAELTQKSILSLIHSLIKLLHTKNSSERTFKKLWRILETKDQSTEQFANGKVLIREISKAKPRNSMKADQFDNNNDGFGYSDIDLRASQKIISFARMMISQSIEDNFILNSNKRVPKIGFSISTQTSSMTHSMSFVREQKSVTVMSTVSFKKSLHHKQKTSTILNLQAQSNETKSVGTQTDVKTNTSNKNNTNWKRTSNLSRFDTISYPYGESPSGFSRPNSGYSPFRKTYNYNFSSNKFSSITISNEDDKYGLIRSRNQKI